MTKLTTDETTYRAGYAAEGGYNAEMEIKATKSGLEIDEHTTVPWDWILRALAALHESSDELWRPSEPFSTYSRTASCACFFRTVFSTFRITRDEPFLELRSKSP
jgi:hypothetical protein